MSRVGSRDKAIRLVVDDARRAVACLTRTQLAVDRKSSSAAGPAGVSFLARSARVKLSTGHWISVAMKVLPERDEARSWRARTMFYAFAIFGTETGRSEFLSYHFHPDTGVSWPHLHVDGRADWAGRRSLRKRHLATGRFFVEDFVQFLIEEFGVEALNRSWKRVLNENRKARAAWEWNRKAPPP